MNSKETVKRIDYEDMSRKLLKALVNEIKNLGYINEGSLQGYFEENAGLDKQQVNRALKWSRYS